MEGYQGGVVLGHIKDDLVENIFRNISMDVNPFQLIRNRILHLLHLL